MRRPTAIIVVALISALAALVIVGSRVLDRDREQLYQGYARERLQVLDEAGRVFEREVRGIAEDLELCSTLLLNVGSEQRAEHEFHAIATIKREYMLLDARRANGSTLHVVAQDAPPDIRERAGAMASSVLDEALRARGELASSGPLGTGPDPASWYRVFALWPATSPDAVAVVVDMRVLLARLDVLRDRTSSLFIVGGDRRTTLREQSLPSALYLLVDAAHRDGTGISVLAPGALALRADTSVAVATTIRVGQGAEPWTLVRVSSAASLQSQERTLVRRLVAGGGLALCLLLASAGYVLYNARRAATLRERLRHAAKLAHLNEKAEKILDHIPSSVLALSDDLRITATNGCLDAKLRRPVVGERIADAFLHAPAAEVALLTALATDARAAGAPRSLHRQRLTLFNSPALLNVHAVPMQRAIADVNVLVVIDDMTVIGRIEERLLSSEKLVMAGQLAAGIAHEIGTPLNIARGRAELALSRLGADHPQAAAQRVIIDQMDLVTRQIQQLLDFVRPSRTEVSAVDVRAAIERVVELLEPQASKRGVSLAATAPVSVSATVRADPDQMQQVLANLVMNALDACSPGGRVEVRACSAAGSAVVEVVDDGHGIPPELRSQVFDPFFTTKKRGQGTGLGLWIVAQLVRSHGGEIELAEGAGPGTIVRVTWPETAP